MSGKNDGFRLTIDLQPGCKMTMIGVCALSVDLFADSNKKERSPQATCRKQEGKASHGSHEQQTGRCPSFPPRLGGTCHLLICRAFPQLEQSRNQTPLAFMRGL